MIKSFTVCVILFVIWQFYVMCKYDFTYNKIRLNKKDENFTVNNRQIKYQNINSIIINPSKTQPNTYERAFAKGAYYVYLTDVEVYLKDGTIEKFKCNTKNQINKIVKELSPYTSIINNSEPMSNAYAKSISISFIAGIIVALCLFFICTHPH